MTSPPVDPKALRFDELAARLYVALLTDAHPTRQPFSDPAEAAAHLAREFIARLSTRDPITGEPRSADPLVDEDDQP